ncbi:MAG TPA: hypothetical protein VF529_04250 [Solirubrobacteraceae bacterium]|jgi:hypothetical protein
MTTPSAGTYAPATYLVGNGGEAIDAVRASGFSTVVIWTIHVWPDGSFHFTDPPIVQDGEWVGDTTWPGLYSRIKQAPSSVDRLLFCVGSADAGDFGNIGELIKLHGTGSDTELYRNFAALRQAIPEIDGIDFDDEEGVDPATIVPLAQMLHEIGYEVTFCPYAEQDTWIECLKTLNDTTPGAVTGFNLQCYAGGGGNDPRQWAEAVSAAIPGFDSTAFVSPGEWSSPSGTCDDVLCPSQVESSFADWKSPEITSGWIWRFDYVEQCAGSGACPEGAAPADYVKAITTGLS